MSHSELSADAMVPAVLMRGGTSKGVFLHERHLPPAGHCGTS
jgi:2-methylaconitate cis-trans-isomerase PrpF